MRISQYFSYGCVYDIRLAENFDSALPDVFFEAYNAESLAWSDDESLLAIGAGNGRLTIWRRPDDK